MMRPNVTGAGLKVAMLMTVGFPAFAHTSATTGIAPPTIEAATEPKKAPKPEASFVAADFDVPTLVEAAGFRIVPLGPDLVKVDFDAYMSSVEHLQKTFSRSTDWPHAGISDADAMRDMEAEQARFRNRTSFAYSVLTPDGRRERGCVYVYPSAVEGYDAVVRMWVTKDEYDAGFDAELYAWVVEWMKKDWPFANVAYPGRAIAWNKWDAMTSANKGGQTASEE